jgi:hypothetical protein
MSFASHKVIAVTPAGRRRYLALLLAYTHREHQAGIIDEHRLFMNTIESADIDWCVKIADSPEFKGFLRLEFPPRGHQGGWQNIHRMFLSCVDYDSLYVRLDDDIVYAAPDALWQLLEFRLEHPRYFIVFPNIINNAICSHLHHRMGILDWPELPGYECMDQLGWNNAKFAEATHRSFLGSLAARTIDRYKFPQWDLTLRERFSINVFCFKGNTFAGFNGSVNKDEEPWLATMKPAELGMINTICGKSIFSHMAFYTQRSHLDSTDILSLYREVARRECPDAPKILEL